jgi:hypothetical protein
MTRPEVVTDAMSSGYAEVETSAGWIRLADWCPLGEHRLHPLVDTPNNRICAQRSPTPIIIQIWPLRKGFRH